MSPRTVETAAPASPPVTATPSVPSSLPDIASEPIVRALKATPISERSLSAAGPRGQYAAFAPDAAATGTRLGIALLAYMLGITVIITLLPFQFDWPDRVRIMVTGGPVDIIANVILFIPLGFLFRLARRNDHRHSALRVLWIGALVSMTIESAQLFEIERFTSVLDVGTNALGAWIGAVAFDRLSTRTRIDGRLIGRLELELPLMGLIYLLVPLLWLNSLSTGGQLEQGAMALLLGIFGASLLGGMQRHHFGPARAIDARVVAVAASLWFMAGAFPTLPARPWILVLGGVAVGAFAWWTGSRPLVYRNDNRRFEVPLLTAAAPLYAAYLVVFTFAPLLDGVGAWSAGIGFPGIAAEWTKTEILRFLELVAAFTLLGYMIAEYRGRIVEEFRAAVGRLAVWGVAACLIGEVVRGFHEGHGASLARGVMLLAASLYGGWLYYLQRAHIVELLSIDQSETL